jgi:hypothetical protein
MKREKGLKNKGFLNSRCFSKGFLFLFGHRARLVKLTERRFRSRPDMIARTRTKGRQTPDHAPMPFTLSTTQGPIVGMLKFAPEIARAIGPFRGFLAIIAFGSYAALLYEKSAYTAFGIIATNAMVLLAAMLHLLMTPEVRRD